MRLVSMCALASVTALPTHFPIERECRWCEEVRGALEQIADTADALRATIDHVARNYYAEAETYTYDTADALRAAAGHVASNYARVFYSDENGILTEDYATYDEGGSGSFREERTHDDTYTYDFGPEPDGYPSFSKLSNDTFWITSDVDERLEALDKLEVAMWTSADVPAFWDAWGGRVDLCLHATESPELRAYALELYGETLFEMPDRKGFYQTTYPRFVVPYLTDQDADVRHTAQRIVNTMSSFTEEGTHTYDAEWKKTWPDEYPLFSKLSDDTFWNTSDVDEHLEALAQLKDAMWTTADVPAFWDAWGGRVDLCLHATESPELRAYALELYGETLFEMPDRKGFYQTTYPRFVVPYLTDQDANVRHTAQGIVDTMRLDTEATYKAFMEEKTSR